MAGEGGLSSAGDGPLAGIRVVEIAGLGPVPFAGMMLADLGAQVLRVERPGGTPGGFVADDREILYRGRSAIALDLRSAEGMTLVHHLAEHADALLEGMRPGVAERLRIGPDELRAKNPGLVYVRCTGWGQEGPLAHRAGHDLTYSAVAGAVGAIGEAGGKPVPALNLISDFGGGGAFAVIGTLAALLARQTTGEGQVVDAAMVDGASYLLASIWSMHNAGYWGPRGTNLLDGGRPFYDTYRCSDGGYIAVGALEPQFWRTLLEALDLLELEPLQLDEGRWPLIRKRLTEAFAARPRAHWEQVFAELDACVEPVLDFDEVAAHPQIAARATLRRRDGLLEPAPAPRFSDTPSDGPPTRSMGARAALEAFGLIASEIGPALEAGVLRDHPPHATPRA